MAKRNYPFWLKAFCDYASYMEAPRRMHFWAGVSAIAGALRRRVWYDQFFFQWHPNFYVVFVAPPGIVSKSTTADVALNLLRAVPGVNFGPDVITWQALVTNLAASTENFQLPNGEWMPMSAITCVASELGNLLNPHDREMVDLLITLWDGRKSLAKETKMSGNDTVEAPWVNIIGCTTPHWIAANVPESMIGGGFTSRCVFIYADTKDKYVPYLRQVVTPAIADAKLLLIQDLERISMLAGEYELTPEAYAWGTEWYKGVWAERPAGLEDERFGGYISRKQTMLHKLGMVISAASRDTLVIEREDLQLADVMIKDVEPDMPKVFARIGKSEEAIQAERFITFIQRRGSVPYEEAYRYIHSHFPNANDFEGIINGAIKAGYLTFSNVGGKVMLVAAKAETIALSVGKTQSL